MKPENLPVSGPKGPTGDCCGSAHAAHASLPAAAVPAGAAGRLFRIATMDCSAEESDIRRALEPITGIRSLGFQLGARTLRIDASEEAYAPALAAIRKAGFDPQPASSGAAQAGGHGHEGHRPRPQPRQAALAAAPPASVAALVLAAGAEAVSFFAPELLAWKIAGMAVAALAIGLAGLDTYKKAWPPCCAASSTSTR